MKASTYKKYGSPGVLELEDLEKPTPKDNEVLIKIYATTVNRTDCAMLRAKPWIMRLLTGLVNPKDPILGTDFAGLIEGVGNHVKTFKIGDKVFGFEDSGLNSHAQYLTLSENKAFAIIPEETSYKEAAACIEGAHYAYNMINKVKLKRGDEVLVNGATGAIGSALVQLLKYFGANITAIANTKNLDLIKSLGANRVIDYTKEDFTLQDRTYNFIFDAVGKSSFPSCKRLLHRDGVYISSELGFMAQNLFFALSTGVIGKLTGRSAHKKVIFPIPYDCKRSVLLIKKLMEEGKFKPVIDRQYPLERIAEAFTYVEKGEKTGNVIITMTDNN